MLSGEKKQPAKQAVVKSDELLPENNVLVVIPISEDHAAGLRAAVLIYISIILAMILSAIGLTKGNPLALVYLGAAIFAVSDFILAIDRFRLNGTSQMASYAVWLTYWPAQLLILLAFL